jgi:hypothetical protein
LEELPLVEGLQNARWSQTQGRRRVEGSSTRDRRTKSFELEDEKGVQIHAVPDFRK